MDMRDVERVVREVLTEQFPASRFSRVSIKPDTDSDGDRILRVVVVFDQEPASLDMDAVVGFVRHLRPRLAEVETEDFPIMSFVSKRDAAKLHLEPV